MDNRTSTFITMITSAYDETWQDGWCTPVSRKFMKSMLRDVEFDDALDIFILCFGATSNEVDFLYKHYGRERENG
jgi:hypothetical protein